MTTSRTRLVLGNWKMNQSRTTTHAFCADLTAALARQPLPAGVQLGVAPPFTLLGDVRAGLTGTPVLLGAQNLHSEPHGAYTGEISAAMLADAGVQWVIIGHSERRTLFGETDERVAAKIPAALAAGLLPVVCVGETQSERDAERTEPVLEDQLRRALGRLDWKPGLQLVLAYEPVWAIGTGRIATPGQVEDAHEFLREILASAIGADHARTVRILYGGSVDARSAPALAELANVDGALVGGASLKCDAFLTIGGAFAGR